MSITLKIDRTEKNKRQMAQWLRETARAVEGGSTIGVDWEIDGEGEPDDEEIPE